jgi:GNAT superfamily N-acetyltransferase
MPGECVLCERHVSVSGAEAIADTVAHEHDSPAGLARLLDGQLLACAAAHADGMGCRKDEPPTLPVIRDDGQVGETGRFEQRSDVETETVGNDGEGQSLGSHPSRERSERGIEGTVVQRERDQLSVGAAERGGLRDEDVAEADLARVERPVDLGERSAARWVRAEPLHQIHAHVVQADGPIEVDDHGPVRQHPGRVAAWEHARMDLAERIMAAGLEGERVRAHVVEGGEVVEVDGLLVAFSNLPAPELNGTRVVREPDDPPAALDAARAVFRSRGHPFFGIEIEVGRHPAMEAAVRAAGLRRVETWPAMAVPISLLPAEHMPEGVAIRHVREGHELAAVRAVEVEAFGTPAEIAERFVGRKMLEDPRVRMFTAWIDGVPVGEASAYLLDDTVGIFGVGVVESARRRGIGSALTLKAARAFDDRTDLAWLQPSDMARRMYEVQGFRRVSDWEVWAAPR